jgi:hypothetical protein
LNYFTKFEFNSLHFIDVRWFGQGHGNPNQTQTDNTSKIIGSIPISHNKENRQRLSFEDNFPVSGLSWR